MMSATSFFSVVSLLSFAPFLSAQNCSALRTLPLPKARVMIAQTEVSGTFRPLHGPANTSLPSFCRIVVQAKPSAQSNINIEVWLPLQWNRRLVGLGSGGFSGIMEYAALADALRENYAAATTDMGTSPASPMQADALIGQPEKWKDFGYRATHVMTIVAKRLIVAFYGKHPEFSYFRGCSTGGQQGLQEAQRFPDEYDGILSGAPAYARTRLHAAILWNYRELRGGVNAGFTPAKLALLSQAVLHACGSPVNGTSLVQVIDPSACAFDPNVLRCTRDNQESCLTEKEVNAVEHVHGGPKTPRGEQTYPGLAWGSEGGWELPAAQGGAETVPFASIFRWVWGPSWNWTAFDFDKEVTTLDQRLGRSLNATSPDLSRFQHLGHKLLLYHGWSDPLVAPQGSINYFDQVLQRGHGDMQQATHTSIRLFMIPGMAHCGGGTGPAHLDLLPALRAWVESGIAPESIVVEPSEGGGAAGTQVVCAYPARAQPAVGSGALSCQPYR